MIVKDGARVYLDADAKAEPADALVYRDYYTISAQIRLSAMPSDGMTGANPATEVVLSDSDVARLVECALRHPERNMRQAVSVAIWNHPETFREIFRLGLKPPAGFGEIAKVAAEELSEAALVPAPPADPGKTLLPRVPVPEHLRGRK
jgi:hypothetical protein